MPQRNVFSWTPMILAYAKSRKYEEAFTLFQQMHQTGVEPDEVVCIVALKECTNAAALKLGRYLHSLISRKSFDSNIVVQNALINMYTKCGCLEEARKLFDDMTKRDVVSWTTIIDGYTQGGLGKEALDLYEQMKRESIEPNTITFVVLLKACASISALHQGRQLHSLIFEKGLESQLNIRTTLIDMYSKCRCLKEARRLFDNMAERNVVSWTTMIAGYAQEGLGKEALDLYEQMESEGIEPDDFTLVLLLKACASISDLRQGKRFHSLILEKGFESQLTVRNALIDMYSKCGRLENAREVFDNMTAKDAISWNAMIAGYVREGLGNQALDLYEQMNREKFEPNHVTLILLLKACAGISGLQQGKQLHSLILGKGLESQLVVQTTLIDMYSKCGCVEDARRLFDNMSERNVVSWTVMIAGYTQEGLGNEALDLFEQMKCEGIEPNTVTLVLLLKACGSISSLQRGRQLHSLIVKKGLESQPIVQNTLIDMYSKCGCLTRARELFDNMAGRDVVSWNAMIAGYAEEGLGKDALDLYEQMQRESIEPSSVTLVLLLKACKSISALQQGKQLHSLILEKGFESQPIVQNTLIDMYSKCGCVKDARELFDTMSERDVVSWTSMIAGYAQAGLGKEALALFQEMKDEGLQAEDTLYSCVLSACSHSCLLDEGRHVLESIPKGSIAQRMKLRVFDVFPWEAVHKFQDFSYDRQGVNKTMG